MLQIKPILNEQSICECNNAMAFSGYLWQGLHIVKKHHCPHCNKDTLFSLPVNQSGIEQYIFYPSSGIVRNNKGSEVRDNWFSKKLKSISSPVEDKVEMEVEILKEHREVIILNTLDFIYGHSLLFLLNLQRIINSGTKYGVIVIIQPMLKWLVPGAGIAEIWTVNLSFGKLKNYYPDLSLKINKQLERFDQVFLSKGYVIPTNNNIEIEKFTGIEPFDFLKRPEFPRITFIWRQDPDRLWIRNYFLLKGCKKLKISKILLPFHYIRVILIFRLLRHKFGAEYRLTVTGLGRSLDLPEYIDDQRINAFNIDTEKKLCRIYAESILVFGVHGSSMILPSAHAGMTISLMPSKRWGNFAEDILFSEKDIRLATYQRRIVPLNISVFQIKDIIYDMISGRDYFISKFIHSAEL